jgi:putative methyltransferase (TIGR04325 family)
VTPPLLLRLVRRLRPALPDLPDWQHLEPGFPAGNDPRAAWGIAAIADAQRDRFPAWLAHLDGTAPPARSHEAPASENVGAQNTHLVFAYALARAAHGRARVRLLDWGCGAGHYARLAQALLPQLDLEYHGHDLPRLVALARELVPHGHFHDDDAWQRGVYDLVLSSSSLQYAPDWRAVFRALARVTGGHFLLTRLPTTEGASYSFVQRAHRAGYPTEYAGWCLCRDDVRAAAAECGLVTVREFLIDEAPEIAGAPTPCRYRAWLFRRGDGA